MEGLPQKQKKDVEMYTSAFGDELWGLRLNQTPIFRFQASLQRHLAYAGVLAGFTLNPKP